MKISLLTSLVVLTLPLLGACAYLHADTITFPNPPNSVVEANVAGGGANYSSLIGANASSSSGEAITYSFSGSGANVMGVGGSQFSFQSSALGLYQITETATETDGDSAQLNFDVKVVDTTPPTLILPGTQTIFENTTLNTKFAATDLVSGTHLIIGCVPTSGTATCDPAGDLSFTPALNFTGTEFIRFTAADGAGNETNSSLEVDVNSPVPEPSSLILLGTGLIGGVSVTRRKFRNN